jgi:hypothetical protein
LDTAAAVSVIGSELYAKHWGTRTLNKPSAVLKGYSGTKLDLAGEFEAKVEYQGQVVTCVLRVIEGNRPALFGRDLLKHLKLDWANIFAVKSDSRLDGILAKYKEVFSEKPGLIKGFEAHIPIDEDAVPRFKKAYSVPFPLQDKVRKQISEAVEKGVYTPVDQSEWASPQVIVVKENGSLRLCGDYKVTVNQVLEKDPYPLPTVDELLAKLSGGSIFTKLDLAEAFQQLALSEQSKKLLTVNTIKGLMQYERMPFGIKTAPQIFQKVMDKLLQGIENVACYIDDILIWSKTLEEHYSVLEKVLGRLSQYNVRARLTKCSFMKESIEYLGHHVDRLGIHPSEGNVAALKNAPVPCDVSELKAFLGLVHYHGKFIKDLSSVVNPLNVLLRKETKWNWSKQCQLAFEKCKQLISADSCLTPYDVTKPIRLACDASAYGVGAMMTHVMDDGSERPVAMASRSLNQAERNYSQLEKEALSIIFGVKKLHKYIYGKKFVILTDHKPLSILLGPKTGIPTLAAARLQRWSLILSAYDYEIEYRKGSDHANADGLSRLPDPKGKPPPDSEVKCIALDSLPVDSGDVQKAIAKDPILARVYDYVLHGWPNHCNDKQLEPYFRKRLELSIENGCLLWGFRVVIPAALKEKLLSELHAEHMGIVSMKRIARGYLWWPCLDDELEALVQKCEVCQSMRNNPAAAPLHPWVYPSTVWERVHVDFAEKDKQFFLILVDSHSKWIEVFPMKTCTTAEKTIDVLRTCFARYGLPQVLVSDNGPQFISAAFETFMKMNGIVHKLVPPYNPSSNGAAERTVQIVKNALEKIVKDKKVDGTLKDISQFLFKYRITPQSTTGKSPAELFLKRVPRSRLSLLKPSLNKQVQKKQDEQCRHHDHGRTSVRTFKLGDSVRVRSSRVGEEKWMLGVVIKICGPLTYVVKVGSTRRYVHVDHLIAAHSDRDSSDVLDQTLAVGDRPIKPTEVMKDFIPTAGENVSSDDMTQDYSLSNGNGGLGDNEINPSTPYKTPSRSTENVATNVTNVSSPVRRYPTRIRKAPTKLDL